LCAVFVPCCFLGGITGQFFRQFAVTIAVSTIISAINAITMTPSRAVMIFKTKEGQHGHELQREALPWWIFGVLGLATLSFVPDYVETRTYDDQNRVVESTGPLGLPGLIRAQDAAEMPAWQAYGLKAIYFAPGMVLGLILGWFVIRPVNLFLSVIFRNFNRAFDVLTVVYGAIVSKMLRLSIIVLLAYGGLLVLTGWQFVNAPTGFVPQQDKGYLILNVQLPDASSVDRTEKIMAKIEDIARATPGVEHTVGISGKSLILNANAPNLGSMYVMLKEFHERDAKGQTADAIALELRERCRKEVAGATVTTFGGPPVDGLGTTGGFKLIIEDRGNIGQKELQRVCDTIVDAANKNETDTLEGLGHSSRASTPWLYLDIDRTKCKALGLEPSDIFNTLQIYLGSYYVNNFNEFGRTWQVNIQADQKFRNKVGDIKQLQVRNSQGRMVRLGTLLEVRETSGPVMIMRYNMYVATAITGNAAPDVSSGEAIDRVQKITERALAHSMAYEWTELTYLQLQAGNAALFAFGLAVMFVFLVLAAQYENWSLPLAVILVVPMCLFCSVTGIMLANMEVNIFTQIGFVVLVGLASKNAILIVEFAKQRREEGIDAWHATLEASRLRLRPILMTSFAFILGVVPLVIATGAGAEMRRSLGLAVFAGMCGVTMFGIFLTPVFYYVLQWHTVAKPTPLPPPIDLKEADAVQPELESKGF
jgi:multidrug efflux pump